MRRVLLAPLIVFSAAILACQQPQTSPPEGAMTLDQVLARQRAAISEREEGGRAFLAKLAEATAAEATNQTWAGKKSTNIRSGYEAAGFEASSLRRLECKSTLCSGEIALSAELMVNAKLPIDSVGQWLSATEPCGFTVAPGERGGAETVIHLFINCGAPVAEK